MKDNEENLEIWFMRMCQKHLVFEPLEFELKPPKRKAEEIFKNMTISIPYDPTYIIIPCIN